MGWIYRMADAAVARGGTPVIDEATFTPAAGDNEPLIEGQFRPA